MNYFDTAERKMNDKFFEVYIIHFNDVLKLFPTSQKVHGMFMTKTARLMECSEITAVYCYDRARCIQGVPGGMDKTSGECSLC